MLADKDILVLQNQVAYFRSETAYKQLFLYFHPRLLRFALGIVKQEELAEEVVSDVLYRMWALEYKLAQVHHLNIYLFKAARNTALNYLKKEFSQWSVTEDIATIPDSTSPDSRLESNELFLLIERAVLQLPQQCQLVYRLIREEGLSYKEAGEVLQVTQNTLETHMRIALKRLKTVLNAYLIQQ